MVQAEVYYCTLLDSTLLYSTLLNCNVHCITFFTIMYMCVCMYALCMYALWMFVCVCVCVLALPFLTSSIFFHFYFPFSLSYYASSLSFPSVVPYPFLPPPFLPSLLTFPHTPYSTLQLTVMKTRGKPEVSAQSSAEQVHRTIHCL